MPSPARCLLLLLLLFLQQALPLAHAATGAWSLDQNLFTLDPGNKFLGRVVATNGSDAPVYVRTRVFRLELRDNKRRLVPDTSGAVAVFPQEFVLRPQTSFPLRLIARPPGAAAEGQSYYVRFEDVSSLAADEAGGSAALSGYLLAFDALVAVAPEPPAPVRRGQLVLRRVGEGLELVNNSGRHLFLQAGADCAEGVLVYERCRAMADFPRQSILPGEALRMPRVQGGAVAMLVVPGLGVRRPVDVVFAELPR